MFEPADLQNKQSAVMVDNDQMTNQANTNEFNQ